MPVFIMLKEYFLNHIDSVFSVNRDIRKTDKG